MHDGQLCGRYADIGPRKRLWDSPISDISLAWKPRAMPTYGDRSAANECLWDLASIEWSLSLALPPFAKCAKDGAHISRAYQGWATRPMVLHSLLLPKEVC